MRRRLTSLSPAAQLSRLTTLRLSDVPQLVTLPRAAAGSSAGDDPRRFAQGSDEWRTARTGHLTAGSFAEAIGFFGGARQARLAAWLAAGGAPYVEPAQRETGAIWGMRHERDALATYLTAYLLPACPDARAEETGFWRMPGEHSLAMGASPDALLAGPSVDSLVPGGALVEVKCPYNAGAPAAHRDLLARSVPQLQGTLLATGRAEAHLVSWGPSGAWVNGLAADALYQDTLLRALRGFGAAVAERRPLDAAELADCEAAREHSAALAAGATPLARIEAADCVQLADE